MEKCAEYSSSEGEKSDFEEDDIEFNHHSTNKNERSHIVHKSLQPVTRYRFVTRLNIRHSLSKMSNDSEIRSKVMALCANNCEALDIAKVTDDSENENYPDDDDDDDVQSPNMIIQSEGKQQQQLQPTNIDLNDIREKATEYDRQQIKGIQLANAGNGNLRVVNNYAVTSNTCTLI